MFQHDSGHRERFLMPESICGGGAVLDVENDGDLDIYLVQSGPLTDDNTPPAANRLFLNDGNGRFDDVTDIAGVGDTGYGMGVTCGDYDNDGLTDIYVSNLGRNVLYRNRGDGTFADATNQAGVGHDGMGSSAAFLDIEGDGDLDLYVANYLNWSIEIEQDCFNNRGAHDYCLPSNYSAHAMDVLYRNNGDGTFTDISSQAGLSSFFGTGLGVAAADFDGSGSLDILVANDGMRDQLWINRGLGRFVDEAVVRGCAYDMSGVAKAGMGVAVGDIDQDGDTDALICNLHGEADSYFLNEGGYFIDNAATSGLGVLTRRWTRFGMGWIDFDNDGHLDLYQANGAVQMLESPETEDPYAEVNLLLFGDGTGQFKEILPRGGTDQPLIATSRAAAFGDLDNDGGIDIVIVNRDGPAHLLRNVAENRGNWVGFRVLDEHGRDALHASLQGDVGNVKVQRDVRVAYSYLASNDPRVHVGLGSASIISNVTIRWPDGTTTSHGNFEAGAYHTIQRTGGS